jgi:nucleoside-diphosphate-sugar epimerase
MSANKYEEWKLFGGAGFIGQHLAISILERSPGDRVEIYDLRTPRRSYRSAAMAGWLDEGRLKVTYSDVRDSSLLRQSNDPADVIVNLAAIHREPGHRPEEYFETNVKGAENLCRLAEETGCREIIFTSSISVYGVHDRPVDERSEPQPKTPYGQSKLEAENIHRDWARRTGGRLTIIRPGVVFGAGEGGNVSRLVREMLHRERKIRIRPDQPKAGIYIEELLGLIHWLRRRPMQESGIQLVNGVSHEELTFNAFGNALHALRGFDKAPMTVSGTVLKLASALLRPASLFVPATSKFHPERLAKLTRANDVRPFQLTADQYPFEWTLSRALADWLGKGL